MKKILLSLIFMILISIALFAQQSPLVNAAVLAYADDTAEIMIKDASGNDISDIQVGMHIPEGSCIRTFTTVAELELEPNGTIIKLSADTIFELKHFQREKSNDTSVFSLFLGKIRIVAARVIGSGYELQTPSVVCGVRGTDFSASVEFGEDDIVTVKEGRVEVYSTIQEKRLFLEPGEFVRSLDADFEKKLVRNYRDARDIFKDMEFSELNPRNVFRDVDWVPVYDYFTKWETVENYDVEFLKNWKWEEEYLNNEFWELFETRINERKEMLEQILEETENQFRKNLNEHLNDAKDRIKEIENRI